MSTFHFSPSTGFFDGQASGLAGTRRDGDGGPAPTLLTSEMVAAMKPGSVIVDLAAERGGNCELTRSGENFTSDSGVIILGRLDLPCTVPAHASLMYANNVANFLLHLCRDGWIDVETQDEVVVGTLVTCDGRVVHERVREVLGSAES
ncbi:MAG TPA: hypothetical protein DCE47_17575 [Planctomycetaceae bacterium]|nr:hypothetical protein [Planctomycetaceae bacterium]|tara:strand:+ start:797 stop:1240 length:444 start_codon:yes stop_codon:yes gene_type:complete